MLPCARTWLFLIALLFWLASCDFFGPDEEASGYYLYVGNWGEDEVFVVDANTNQVVRTLRGFKQGLGGVWTNIVSKSGRKLYVDTREGTYLSPGKLYVVDVGRWSPKVLLDQAAEAYVAPQGEVFVFTRDRARSEEAVGRVDTLTDQVAFFDTLDLRQSGNREPVVFDPHRPLLYAVNSTGELFAYDYAQHTVVRTYQNVSDPYHMVISPDGRRLYVAGGPIFDLERDSVVAWVGGNQLGSLALSPSGDSLYVTDPGRYLIPEPIAAGKVFLYDTRSYRYIGEVDVTAASPVPGVGDLTDEIVLSPDGKTAYVSNWLDLVFVIDLTAGKVIDLIQPRERNIHTVPLTLGAKP